MHKWRISEARASFATVLERAGSAGPQLIVNRDQVVAAVVGADAARRMEQEEEPDGKPRRQVRQALEQLRVLRAQAIADGVVSVEENIGLELAPVSADGFQNPFPDTTDAPLSR